MPWVGFEPIIPMFERAKKFYALERAATVIGPVAINLMYLKLYIFELDRDPLNIITKPKYCMLNILSDISFLMLCFYVYLTTKHQLQR
jgi:hypothetical protein